MDSSQGGNQRGRSIPRPFYTCSNTRGKIAGHVDMVAWVPNPEQHATLLLTRRGGAGRRCWLWNSLQQIPDQGWQTILGLLTPWRLQPADRPAVTSGGEEHEVGNTHSVIAVYPVQPRCRLSCRCCETSIPHSYITGRVQEFRGARGLENDYTVLFSVQETDYTNVGW